MSSFNFNVITVGVMWSVLALTQIAGGFSGADPNVTAIACVIVSLFPVLLYGVWTATIPRSGGDYVWISRTFKPWLGLAVNVNATTWYVLGNGFLAYLIAQSALPTAFQTLGQAFQNSTLTSWATAVGNPWWTFAIGVAALVASGVLTALVSMRRSMRIVAGFFVITLLGLVVAIAILATHSQADFARAIAQNGGDYQKILSAAQAAGYDTGAHYQLWSSLLAMPPLYLALAYTVAAAYTGGEIRNPGRAGILGPLAASLLVGILVIIAFALAGQAMGFHWIGAASFLSASGSKDYPFTEPAGFFFFVSMLTQNKIVLVIIAVAFVAAPLSTILATVLFATRNLFAWSFDRMLPSSVSAINERTATPVVAPVIITVISTIYLAFLIWGGPTFSAALGAIILGTTLSFMVTALGAIALPWLRPRLFANAPIRSSVLGVPVFSLIGLIALVVYAFMFYALLTQAANGSSNATSIGAMVVVALISLVLYPLAYVANSRRGIDLSLVGKELPPE
jgi:amino acid transporter